MKYVFILYVVTLFGDSGYGISGTKVWGKTYWDASRACEAVARSKIAFPEYKDKDKKESRGYYCEPAKDNPQF